VIQFQYHQLARQIHQERIQAALKPRPEWPLVVRSVSSRRSFAGWNGLKAIMRWTILVIQRGNKSSPVNWSKSGSPGTSL
jgi:hypothetical protein